MTIEFRRNPTRITKAEVSGASDDGATVHLTLRIGLRADQLETFAEGRYALSDLRVYAGLVAEWRARVEEERENWDAMIDRLTADHQAAVQEADESGTPRPRPPRELGMAFSEPPPPEQTKAQRMAPSLADQHLHVVAEYTDEMTHEVRQAVIDRGIKGTPKLVTEGGEAFLEARLNPTYLPMEDNELWSWLRMTGRELVITDVQMGIDEAAPTEHHPRTFAEHLLAAMLGGETAVTAGLVVLKRLRDRGESEATIIAEATALADDEARPEMLRTAAAAVLQWQRQGSNQSAVEAPAPARQIDITDYGAGEIDTRVTRCVYEHAKGCGVDSATYIATAAQLGVQLRNHLTRVPLDDEQRIADAIAAASSHAEASA